MERTTASTAIFGRQLGLGTRLLLYPQPVTRLVKEKLLLFHHYGVELRCYRTLLGAGVALYTTQRVANPRAYVLHSGGSSPLGTIGVVNAMFELRAQVDAGMLPNPISSSAHWVRAAPWRAFRWVACWPGSSRR